MDAECRECGRTADPAYTLRFDDIGEPPVHFCDVCGPPAHELTAMIEKKLREEPGFAKVFEEVMDDVVARDGGIQ